MLVILRIAIDPRTDGTTETPNPWFLYNKTRDYINEARALAK